MQVSYRTPNFVHVRFQGTNSKRKRPMCKLEQDVEVNVGKIEISISVLAAADEHMQTDQLLCRQPFLRVIRSYHCQ